VGFLAINLDMGGRRALLAGAGRVGRRMLSDLLTAGAAVLVVEPRPSEEVRALAAEGRIRLEARFEEAFLDDRPIVFAALDDPGEGRRLAALARSKGLWVNVADQPADCDFHVPAVADLSPLRLAVTTDGGSPALAAAVAADARVRYRGHGRLAAILGRLRPLVMASGLSPECRREILLRAASDAGLADLLADGRTPEAMARLRELIRPVEPPEDFFAAMSEESW
jgi:siroheme synthase-like protein